MSTNLKASKNGFTLIEVLVVITIIGILAAFVLSSVSQIQKNSRDEKRKSDLNSLASVLQRFYNDNGSYPTSSSGKIQYYSGPGSNCTSTGTLTTDTWGTDGIICNSKTYLKVLPDDPFGSSRQSYCYESASGTTYTLGAVLENTNDPEGEKDSSGNPTTFTCNSKSNYNYKITPNR